MGTEKIQKGDLGTVIQVLINQAGTDTAEDVSDATGEITVKVELKDGTVVDHTGSFVGDGTDGLVQFTSTAATFAQAGEAKLQVYLENGAATKKHHTTERAFIINDALD